MRTCSKCKNTLNCSDFYIDKKSKGGLSYWCRGCVKENIKRHREKPEYRKRQEEWNNKWRSRPENRQTILNTRTKSQKKIYAGLKVAGFVTKTIRDRVLCRDGHKCLACDTRESLTIDHIVPVVLGGLTNDANLQTLCRSCNAKKQQKVTSYR